MLNTLIEAFALISTWEVIIAMLAASVYGLVIGSLPGLSATMATALLVPVTFYLSPIAAIATIVAASTMAIFSGDIPGALLRIPGTPASAAYADEAYAMTRKGEAELALGAGVWFSAVGGIAGTLSLMILAPPLAEVALSFSTFEYFWLAFLGLMCATLVARSSPGEGDRRHVHRPAGRVHRHRKPRRRAALHLRPDRPVRRHRADPGAGRRLCRGAGDARDADAGTAADPEAQVRKHHGGPVEAHQEISTGR